MSLALDDHEPRRLEGSTQSFCPQTRMWLLIDRWGHVIASNVDQWPGLPVRDLPQDAKHLLGLIALQYQPWVDVTEDGIAIIQWRAAKGGLALLFGGDNSVTVSERTMTANYVDSSTDYDLSVSTGAIISASLRNLYS
jgi:hypothetical protein